MTGLPHHGSAAVFLDIVKKILRAFHLGDDRCTRIRLKDRSREQDHQLIAPDDATVLIHHSDAIAVAVERETDIGAVIVNGSYRVLKIFGNGRIRVMVWKV